MPIENRGLGVLLAIALAWAALRNFVGPSGADSATASKSDVPSEMKDDDRKTSSVEVSGAGPAACDEGERLISEYASLYVRPRSPEPLYLIALVPDPEEAGHTDYFDAVLDGIEDATAAGVATHGVGSARVAYRRDRHWLPWSARRCSRPPYVLGQRPVCASDARQLSCRGCDAGHVLPSSREIASGTVTGDDVKQLLESGWPPVDGKRGAGAEPGGARHVSLGGPWSGVLLPTWAGRCPA